MNKDMLIVITGAGGFIGGNLAKYFSDKGFTGIRAVDKKPICEWYLCVPGVENLCLDCSREANCNRVCEGAEEVFNLAADMGGMGFIERFRIECLRSILINTHMIEAAYRAGADRYFFSSSACAYSTLLQEDTNARALKESDAYPAMAERGYGWEKLISEMFCQEYWAERGMNTVYPSWRQTSVRSWRTLSKVVRDSYASRSIPSILRTSWKHIFKATCLTNWGARRKEIPDYAEARHSWNIVAEITRNVYAQLAGDHS
jgi:hypothetical protein